MADSLTGVGRLADAESGYRKAISLRPGDAKLHSRYPTMTFTARS
jgi:hypothetical protein